MPRTFQKRAGPSQWAQERGGGPQAGGLFDLLPADAPPSPAMTVTDEAGHTLRNGKSKRTVEEQQAANDQKRAALDDISNKALQRCEQVTTSPRAARLTGLAARARGPPGRRRPAPARPGPPRPPREALLGPRSPATPRALRAHPPAWPQGISKLGVATTANVQTRGASMRMTRLAARQLQQGAAAFTVSDDLDPMSVEKSKPDILDIDSAFDSDTQMCTAYVHDIYVHLGEIEQQHRIMVHYMHGQKDINSTMRGILIDWLVEVAEEYRLVPETLYLAVNYIDRFLQCVPVNRSKLQLVGVTCMLIASYAPPPRFARGARPRTSDRARRASVLTRPMPRAAVRVPHARAGSTRRSTRRRWTSSCTSRTTPTRARRCARLSPHARARPLSEPRARSSRLEPLRPRAHLRRLARSCGWRPASSTNWTSSSPSRRRRCS